MFNFSEKNNQHFHLFQRLLWRLAAVYAAMAAIRLIFWAYNRAFFSNMPNSELLGSWFWGLRFDTVAIIYSNSLFILSQLLPIRSRFKSWYQRAAGWFFLAGNAAMFFVEMVDICYFPFSTRRIVKSDFDMQQDFINLLPQFLSQYWWLLSIGLLMLYSLHRFYQKTQPVQPSESLPNWDFYPKQTLIFGLGLGLGILGMRGGWQTRPLTALTAAQYVSNPQFAPLVSNSSLNLIHSFQQAALSKKTYLSDAELANYQIVSNYQPNGQPMRKLNVVLLIIESYGQEYIHHFNPKLPPITPFFDSLCQTGLLFGNSHSNGTRSTQGIAAISAGFPALMQDPFMFSAYQGNQLSSLASHLGKVGYESWFSHPANDGSMSFDTYSKQVGFQHYLGRQAYEKAKGSGDFDGGWGIFDQPFYHFLIEELGRSKQPFFCSHFSTSPHHPYTVPADFGSQYPQLTAEQKAIRYADFCLSDFFARAKQQPWYNNTLFIITADHIGAAFEPFYNLKSQRYKIPLIFFQPQDSSLRGQSPQLAQQVDILPTTLRYLAYPLEFRAFGKDLLANSATPNYHYTFDNGLYQLLSDSFLLHFDGEKTVGFYQYQPDTLLQNNLVGSNLPQMRQHEKQLQAVIQTYQQLLLENKLP